MKYLLKSEVEKLNLEDRVVAINRVAKNLGTSNPRNIINACVEAFSNMKTVEEIARLRGKSVEEFDY